jgi:hypothetical protein
MLSSTRAINMPRGVSVRRTPVLAAVSAAVFLVSGCGVSHDAPRPGVAAEIGGATMSLTDLNTLVDAVCIATTDAPQGQATTRGIAAATELRGWITAQAFIQYAVAHNLPGIRTVQDVSSVPGIGRMTAAERAELQSFIDDQAQASAINKATAGLQLDPADFNIVINPRFDTSVTGNGLVQTDNQLSVAVSSEALADQAQPTAARLAALPESQLCGRRPTIGANPVQ